VSPNATQGFTLTVDVAPTITSGDAATFSEGAPETFTVTTVALPTAALSESGTLPSGLSFADNGDGTASLSGTPAAGTAGSYPLTITATNGVAPDDVQNFTLTVHFGPAITSAASTTFTEQESGSFTVTTVGAPTPAVTEHGSLPSGVTFVDDGNGTATLAGTPATGTSGTYALTITASNGVGSPDNQSFTLTVNRVAAFTSTASTTFTVGSRGTFTVSTTGSPSPQLSESGTLPSGVTFQNQGNGTALLSGTPAINTTGTYGIFITAHNGVGSDAVQSFTLTVNGLQITTASLPAGNLRQPYVTTVEASGGPLPYKWKILHGQGKLPKGLKINKAAGEISGKPSKSGSYTFTVEVKDTNHPRDMATKSFTIVIS